MRLRLDNNDSRRVGAPKVRETQATWKISGNVWRDLKYGNEPLELFFLIKRIRRSELVMFQIGRQSAVGSGLHGLQSLLLRQTGVSSSTELMKRQ